MQNSALMPPPAAALDRLLDQVRSGGDAVIEAQGNAGGAVLETAASRLAEQGFRVLQVTALPPGLSLSGLMAQVTGRPDLAAQDDAVLEAGYHLLTKPDESCSGIALLVSGAELLQRPTLRYIQFTARGASALRLVMAGGPDFAAVLAGDDFAALRARLSAAPPITLPASVPAPIAAPVLVAGAPLLPAAVERRRRRGAAWMGIGAGMAASIGLGVLIGRNVGPAEVVPVTVVPATTGQPLALAPQAVAPSATMPVVQAPAATPPVPTPPVPNLPEPTPFKPTAETKQAALPPLLPVPPPLPPPDTQAPAAAAPVSPAPATVETAPAPLPIPPRAPAVRQAETHPKEAPSLARRSPPSRLAARAPGPPRDPEWEEQAPRPPYGWRPPPPQVAAYPGWVQPYSRPQPYIGTYTTDSYGVRTFRFGP